MYREINRHKTDETLYRSSTSTIVTHTLHVYRFCACLQNELLYISERPVIIEVTIVQNAVQLADMSMSVVSSRSWSSSEVTVPARSSISSLIICLRYNGIVCLALGYDHAVYGQSEFNSAFILFSQSIFAKFVKQIGFKLSCIKKRSYERRDTIFFQAYTNLILNDSTYRFVRSLHTLTLMITAPSNLILERQAFVHTYNES